MAPQALVYEAGKSAVIGMTRQMACDFGPLGIRVNAICPGIIANPRTEAHLAANPHEEWAARETQPLGRYGRPDDIAWAVVFLASDESSFMTGATLVVDGGLSIMSPEAIVRPSFRRRWRQGVLVLRDE